MALQNLPGSRRMLIGLYPGNVTLTTPSAATSSVLDAANEALIYTGYIETSDGGSHTIDTSGSSSLEWRTGPVTFSDGGTTVKVGLAAVDTAAGPPARAVNSSGVITFDVSRTMTGGGGGITSDAAQNHVPDSGSKTIANGDRVAFAVQMTALGGSDSITISSVNTIFSALHLTQTVLFTGTYASQVLIPNCFITFSDGATGWFYGGDVFTSRSILTPSSTNDEAGQSFQIPFPMRIYGMYGWIDPDNNFDFILYSAADSSSPVPEKTIAIDENTVASATGRYFEVLFPSPYDAGTDEVLGVAVKRLAAGTFSTYEKVYADAAHRISDPWGTLGSKITRSGASGAFSTTSTGAVYLGLIAGAFDDGA